MNKEDYSLRVSVYGGATRKEVKNELERQNGILAELSQFPEENAEDISAVEQNIAALKLKRNHIASELAGKGIDKMGYTHCILRFSFDFADLDVLDIFERSARICDQCVCFSEIFQFRQL